MGKRLFYRIANKLAVVLSIHALTACAFKTQGSGTTSTATNVESGAAGSIALSQTAFQSSVYSYVKTISCSQCHATGPTQPQDWFASSNPSTAFQSAISLVNTSDPAASLLAVRISDNHCGFASICGISNATMVAQIQSWISQSAAAPPTPASSCTFNNQTMASGTSVSAYSASTVPFGSSCSSVQITVSCANGVLSPSTAYASCSPAAGASCTFSGSTIASGATTQGYPSATVPYGQTCQPNTITCTNGVLNPANDVAACSVQTAQSCSFNGQTIASGGTVTAYQAGSVGAGSKCVSQVETCTNGSLNGPNGSYAYSSCNVGAPATCSFNGSTLQSGATTQGYAAASVPFGQTCQMETVTCTNGVLSPASAVTSCSVQAGATCSFNGHTIASGATTQGYASASVPYGQTCQAQTITCTNGVLNPASDVGSCAPLPPASCSFNGATIASGSSTTGYASATVPSGQTCNSESVSCSNGVLNPPSASPTCTVSSSAAYGSTFVPTNNALLIRLNLGLNPPGLAPTASGAYQCQDPYYCNNVGCNQYCSKLWNNAAQYNVNFQPNPNTSSGEGQIALLAFAGCNDTDPGVFGVDITSTVAKQNANLINAGVQFVNNHTGNLAQAGGPFNAQVQAAFQTLINDPSFSGASVHTVFIGICTAANTFGVGMRGF